MAKSIPRNLSAGLFSTVWFSQQNKRLAKYFPDGSRLTVTDLSFQSDGICRWSFIFMAAIFTVSVTFATALACNKFCNLLAQFIKLVTADISKT